MRTGEDGEGGEGGKGGEGGEGGDVGSWSADFERRRLQKFPMACRAERGRLGTLMAARSR